MHGSVEKHIVTTSCCEYMKTNANDNTQSSVIKQQIKYLFVFCLWLQNVGTSLSLVDSIDVISIKL